jgi:CBS-domain-containing membrane protein
MSYRALSAIPLRKPATFRQPPQSPPRRVRPDDPALDVLTDLTKVSAVTIDPDASIGHAMRVMVRRNVRLLFAVDVDNEIVGLVTATDLLGEKPLVHLREQRGRRGDIVVRDLMTPSERLEVLRFEEVRQAKVGHILATLKESARQHALVVDCEPDGTQTVRGIFSASQLAQQLGEGLQITERAYTFADIEAALNHR